MNVAGLSSGETVVVVTADGKEIEFEVVTARETKSGPVDATVRVLVNEDGWRN